MNNKIKTSYLTVPYLIANSNVVKRFKRIKHEKFNVGQLPIYDIRGGDNALSYHPFKKIWLFAPTVNMYIPGTGDNILENLIKRDRRCYINGSLYTNDVKSFEALFNSFKSYEDRELLMITWGYNS